MVKDEPVSLMRQTIYCLIPLLDIYAAFRVKRLRRYLLIMLPIGFVLGMVDSTLFPEYGWEDIGDATSSFLFLDYVKYADDPIRLPTMIAYQVGIILLAIFLVRRWSKQWNQKFESSTEST